MAAPEPPKSNLSFPNPNRLEALSECVYSIAMTLLVLNVKIPNLPQAQAAHLLPSVILGVLFRLHDYLISFVILGSFWISSHHQLHHIRTVDRPFLWINLIILMFITLIPFSASLVGDYGSYQIAVLFFDIHLLIVNLLFWVNRHYAKNNNLLKPEHDLKWVNRVGNLDSLINLTLIGVSILWSFLDPHWCKLPFLLLPWTPMLARRFAKLS